jgi:hypothetical protein
MLIHTETTKAIYTNTTQIPEPIATNLILISESSYSGVKAPKRISATQFLQAPKQIMLSFTPNYKPVIDISTITNSVIGSILHKQLMPTPPTRQIKILANWEITGEADYIQGDVLKDLKVKSVYSGLKLLKELKQAPQYFKLPVKDLQSKYPSIFSYVMQLSIYKWLYDLPIDTGSILFIHSDWNAKNSSEISKIHEVDFILLPEDILLNYLTERIAELDQISVTGEMPDCDNNTCGITSETSYKLVKPGKKIRVAGSKECTTYEDILAEQENYPGTEILHIKRNSPPVLCTKYCNYNAICAQGQFLAHA